MHYLRFSFTDAQRAAFADGPVTLVVDHPEYQAATSSSTDEQHAELVGDFASDAPRDAARRAGAQVA